LISAEENEALERTRRGEQTAIVVEDARAKFRECLEHCASHKFTGKKPNREHAINWLLPYQGNGICFVIARHELPEALMGLTFRYAAIANTIGDAKRALVLERVIT